jgi:glycosyltransferase involved in cell wall biosynthesis
VNLILDSILPVVDRFQEAVCVFACRLKSEKARSVEAALRRRVAREGLEGHTLFLNEVPDMGSLIASCDVCLMPLEGLRGKLDIPFVLLEAMARSRAAVVSELPSLKEAVGLDGGICIPILDRDALVETLCDLCEDEGRRHTLGEAARARVQTHFSLERQGEAYGNLYRSLIGKP